LQSNATTACGRYKPKPNVAWMQRSGIRGARRSGPWPQPHPKTCRCHQSHQFAQPTLAVAGTAGSYKNAFSGAPSLFLPVPARRRGDPAFRLHRPPRPDTKTRDRPAQAIPCPAGPLPPAPHHGPARKIRARPSARQKCRHGARQPDPRRAAGTDPKRRRMARHAPHPQPPRAPAISAIPCAQRSTPSMLTCKRGSPYEQPATQR
jgi:hypothetical protein